MGLLLRGGEGKGKEGRAGEGRGGERKRRGGEGGKGTPPIISDTPQLAFSRNMPG